MSEWVANWKWCFTCDLPFLECPHCANNSCNGGCGQRLDSSERIKHEDLWCTKSGWNKFYEVAVKSAPIKPTKEQVLEAMENYVKFYSSLNESEKLTFAGSFMFPKQVEKIRQYCSDFKLTELPDFRHLQEDLDNIQ